MTLRAFRPRLCERPPGKRLVSPLGRARARARASRPARGLTGLNGAPAARYPAGSPAGPDLDAVTGTYAVGESFLRGRPHGETRLGALAGLRSGQVLNDFRRDPRIAPEPPTAVGGAGKIFESHLWPR
jgi:hypothetical protein